MYLKKFEQLRKFKETSFSIRVRNKLRWIIAEILGFLIKIVDVIFKLNKTNRVQFLYIHYTFEDQIDKLEKLILFLKKRYNIISYSQATDLILNNKTIDKPYMCISSDDGLKNNLLFAKILNKHKLSACFFICPEIVNNCKSYEYINNICLNKLNIGPVEFLDWEDVNFLQSSGHEIGGHTMSHVNLSEISRNEMNYEIKECFKSLKSKNINVKHFAWPYGKFKHINNEAVKMIIQSGFQSLSSAERGCHFQNNNDQIFIRRDHISLDWSINEINFFILKNTLRIKFIK